MSNSPSHSHLNTRKFGRRIWEFIRSHLRLFSRHPCNYSFIINAKTAYSNKVNFFCASKENSEVQIEIMLKVYTSATVIVFTFKLYGDSDLSLPDHRSLINFANVIASFPPAPKGFSVFMSSLYSLPWKEKKQ